MADAPDVDLTNCDREPIHIPGSIQPHGCLLVCDPEAVTIRRHSDNVAAFLDLGETELIGMPLERLVTPHVVHELRNALARSGDASHPGLLTGVRLREDGPLFDLSVHRHDGNALIEIEPSPPHTSLSPLEFSRTLIQRVGRFNSIERLVRKSTRLLRAVLQYDRVMIYRFAPDGSGKVVSEARRADLESFLGQHFPASDIPQQARRLYLANPIRIVSDASGDRVAIRPALDERGRPVDLSFAHLRSVSPIHCEYLRNMGVGASMSISIIIGGELWGLIACHHYTPRTLPVNLRVAAETFGEFLSLQLDSLIRAEKLDASERARRFVDKLLEGAPQADDISAFLRDTLPEFQKLIACDGVGLWVGGKWFGLGETPSADESAALVGFIESASGGGVWAHHRLAEVYPAALPYRARAAGVLSVPLSRRGADYLLFFRREVIETIAWGGDPNKQYETGPHGDRLTPRKSFAIWKETVEGQCQPWSDDDRGAAESTRAALVEAVLHHNELLEEEKRKADLRQKLLNEELNHRVKNILALIRSLVSRPLEPGQSVEDYVEALKGRIVALSVAHDQIVRGSGGGALADLLDAELTPYRSASDVDVAGPAVQLDGRAYSVLALVLHELATNAAKYGSLSRPGGTLSIAWQRDADAGLVLSWQEAGGPPVAAPTTRGFGTVLIQRSVPFDLGGRAEVDYAAGGLRAQIMLPSKYLAWNQEALPDGNALLAAEADDAALPLAGRSVLVVEDQFLIAMHLESMLADAGAATVEICATLAEAFASLKRAKPDVAVLDIHLGAETSEPLARQLAMERIPFVFASGFGDAGLPTGFPGVPLVRKPYSEQVLMRALTELLAGRPVALS